MDDDNDDEAVRYIHIHSSSTSVAVRTVYTAVLLIGNGTAVRLLRTNPRACPNRRTLSPRELGLDAGRTYV